MCGTIHDAKMIRDPGPCCQAFFPDLVPENFIPLGNLFSPNLAFLKVHGGCHMEKYSATRVLKPNNRVD